MKYSPLNIPRACLRLLLFFPKRKREKHFPNTNTQSEVEAMSTQDWYGHLDNKKTIEDWLSEHYLSRDNIALPKRLDFVLNILEQSKCEGPILELGGGASDMSAYLRSRYSNNDSDSNIFIISDISRALIDNFFSKVCLFFGVEYSEFSQITAQAESIPITSNSCRAVIAKSAVHHFDNFEKAKWEIHRVIKENGCFVFINDPISRFNFSTNTIMGNISDLELGFNCRTYHLRDYLSLGTPFKKMSIHLDPGFQDYLASQLFPYWGRFSIRAIASEVLMYFKTGRTLLSIYLGIPLIFECRK